MRKTYIDRGAAACSETIRRNPIGDKVPFHDSEWTSVGTFGIQGDIIERGLFTERDTMMAANH